MTPPDTAARLAEPQAPSSRPAGEVASALPWLALLFIGGLLLRLVGVGFLLPHAVFSDSLAITQEVEQLRGVGRGVERPCTGLYPQLLPRLGLLAPVAADHASGPLALEEHVARAARPRRDLRIVLTLAALLAVPATWSLARSFLGPRWALVAAAFVATSFLDTWFAPQERPHSALSAFSLVAVLNILELRRRPCLRTFLFAGLAMAIAIGTLQSGVAVLLPFAAALVLAGGRTRSLSPSSRVGRSKLAGSALALGVAALAIPCFYPFLFERRALVGLGPPTLSESTLNLSGHHIRLGFLNGGGADTVLWTMWSYEPLVSLLALAGAAAGVWRLLRGGLSLKEERKKDLFVVLAYAVPYGLMISLYEETGQRFCLPLVPYAAVLAAGCLRDLCGAARSILASPVARRATAAVLVGVPLSAEAYCSGSLASLRVAPDTGTRAAAWIRAHLEADADRILVSPRLEIPLFQSERALARNESARDPDNQPWFAYQCDLPPSGRCFDGYDLVRLPVRDREWTAAFLEDPRARLRSLRVRYAVVEVREGWGWKGLSRLRSAVREEGALLARFEPNEAGSSRGLPFEHQDDALRERVHWLWRALHARCTGPVIEIYRLDEPKEPEPPRG